MPSSSSSRCAGRRSPLSSAPHCSGLPLVIKLFQSAQFPVPPPRRPVPHPIPLAPQDPRQKLHIISFRRRVCVFLSRTRSGRWRFCMVLAAAAPAPAPPKNHAPPVAWVLVENGCLEGEGELESSCPSSPPPQDDNIRGSGKPTTNQPRRQDMVGGEKVHRTHREAEISRRWRRR